MVRTPAWDRARSHSLQYSRRDPAEQALYRIVYHYWEELEYSWSQQFEHKYGCLRMEVKEAFESFLNCGILLHGCARAVCEECQHSELIPFSCKRKFICSSCDAKRALLFGEHLHENVLLEYPHVHQVFSIPKILRPRFKFNRKLLSLLFKSSWSAWQRLVSELLPDCRAASVYSLHSAGDLLHWHPHIHGFSLFGGISPSGDFVGLESVDTELLTNYFSEHLLDSLVSRGELEEETVELITGWEHSGFQAFVGEPIEASDADARQFIGRYLKKSAVCNSRLELLESDGIVRVHKEVDDYKTHRDFGALEFLAELAQHVPYRREQTVRYLGAYSARSRGAKRLALATPGPLPETEPPVRPSASWARCISQVFELDPLECPKCGGNMQIKAFLTDSKEISRLAKNLGLQAWRAPPPLPISFQRAA